jgi:multicomponent Na+:H+ antiporter subunit G
VSAQGAVGSVLVVLGTLLIGVAAVGMLRLPDFYNRANAVAKAASLGVVLVLLGVLVLVPSPSTAVTVGIAIFLQLFTVPVAGFALGGAAYRSGAPVMPGTRDELAERPSPD